MSMCLYTQNQCVRVLSATEFSTVLHECYKTAFFIDVSKYSKYGVISHVPSTEREGERERMSQAGTIMQAQQVVEQLREQATLDRARVSDSSRE